MITTSSTTVQTFGQQFLNHPTRPRETSPTLWSLTKTDGCDPDGVFVAVARRYDGVHVIGLYSTANAAEVCWADSGWPQQGYSLDVTKISIGTTRKHSQGQQ